MNASVQAANHRAALRRRRWTSRPIHKARSDPYSSGVLRQRSPAAAGGRSPGRGCLRRRRRRRALGQMAACLRRALPRLAVWRWDSASCDAAAESTSAAYKSSSAAAESTSAGAGSSSATSKLSSASTSPPTAAPCRFPCMVAHPRPLAREAVRCARAYLATLMNSVGTTRTRST